MANIGEKEAAVDDGRAPVNQVLPAGVDDIGAIPKGHIDPVYEAKVRALQHATWSLSNKPRGQSLESCYTGISDSP